MADIPVQFKMGLKDDLPEQKQKGAVYVTKDEGGLYVDINDSERLRIGKESIIALSVKGTTVTYIKADGSTHSFETQDTDTKYYLATDETLGITKLYAQTGTAEDGSMTQKAIKTELDKKVGVTVNEADNTLIFTQ